jgi:hypothetical protein
LRTGISKAALGISPRDLELLPDFPDLSRLNYLCTLYQKTKHLTEPPDAAAFLDNDADEAVCGELRDEDIVQTIMMKKKSILAAVSSHTVTPDAASPTPPEEVHVTCAAARDALSVLQSFFRQRHASSSAVRDLSTIEHEFTRLALTELHQQFINPYIVVIDSHTPIPSIHTSP